MPQFKIRSEGQKIRRGDQIVLLHQKSNLPVSLSKVEVADKKYEINVSTVSTGWKIESFAPFPSTENALKSLDSKNSILDLIFPLNQF